jgi:hypothetical protein
MSRVLAGILEPNIRSVVEGFGKAEYSGPLNAANAQDKFIRELTNAISVSIQQYLVSNVTVIPGQVVITAGGPTNQAGATTTPGILNAP